ncbi:hypothetical protein MTR67_053555 [Solanum verrucosum]|uniref:Glycine-rich protein n=1 Tax=Solanum verrucosum TaxID=315347 RepID=A0AAF1A443_SOLVR|nr:hypothetical protein MTR67_053555 [Solanum verrucosum]
MVPQGVLLSVNGVIHESNRVKTQVPRISIQYAVDPVEHSKGLSQHPSQYYRGFIDSQYGRGGGYGRGYPGGGYGRGGGGYGRGGGGYGRGGGGGGYGHGGGGRHGGYCRYGCCHHDHNGCYKCCSYKGEAMDKVTQGKPQN